MDFNRQHNRPTQRVAPAPRVATPTETPAAAGTNSVDAYRAAPGKQRGLKHFLILSVTALTLLGGGYALGSLLPVSSDGEFGRVNAETYQAVFLTNDQVYFGKIREITDTVVAMENIYYLQETAGEKPATGQAATSNQEPKMALAKLGSELHGPEDRMQINRDQVLFWENLKSDSQVSEAIKAYKP